MRWEGSKHAVDEEAGEVEKWVTDVFANEAWIPRQIRAAQLVRIDCRDGKVMVWPACHGIRVKTRKWAGAGLVWSAPCACSAHMRSPMWPKFNLPSHMRSP